jgi:hypothetical protein
MGKRSEHTSDRLFVVLESVSKSAWIEFAVNMTRARIGRDATDEDVAAFLQTRLAPIARSRGDYPPRFDKIFAQIHAYARKYEKSRVGQKRKND